MGNASKKEANQERTPSGCKEAPHSGTAHNQENGDNCFAFAVASCVRSYFISNKLPLDEYGLSDYDAYVKELTATYGLSTGGAQTYDVLERELVRINLKHNMHLKLRHLTQDEVINSLLKLNRCVIFSFKTTPNVHYEFQKFFEPSPEPPHDGKFDEDIMDIIPSLWKEDKPSHPVLSSDDLSDTSLKGAVGHATLCVAYHPDYSYLKFKNSYGSSFGTNGRFRIYDTALRDENKWIVIRFGIFTNSEEVVLRSPV